MKKIRHLFGILAITIQDCLLKPLIIWSAGPNVNRNKPREFQVEQAEAFIRRGYDDRTRTLATIVFLLVLSSLSSAGIVAMSGPDFICSAGAVIVIGTLLHRALFRR